jgi:opacity protein-like surface antigen|tara:strand:+ start:19955 stop:20323 length:369 start_codon:yes stop_codon:yes gene_type:complete
MIKAFIISAVVLGLSATTVAAEVKNPSSKKINFAVISETEHNFDAETTNTEFGLTAAKNGFKVSFLPNWNWDDKEIDNIQLGLSYDYALTKSFTLSPYGEYNVDNDLKEKDKIVGLRTKFTF